MKGKRPHDGDPMREAKREKMRNRRVSFAPDDELETMHLFPKDGKLPLQDVTDTGNILLDNTFLRTVEDHQVKQQQQQPTAGNSFLPLAGVPPLAALPVPPPPPPPRYQDLYPQSPDPMSLPSPASMDISMNSPFPQRSPYQSGMANGHSGSLPMPASNGGGYYDENAAPFSYLQQPQNQVQPPPQSPSQLPAEYTRSITVNLPGLSTLVEEDEEAGLEAAELSDIAARCRSTSMSQLAGDGRVCDLRFDDATDPLAGVPSSLGPLPHAGDGDDDDDSCPGQCYSPSTMSPATPAVLNLPGGRGRDNGGAGTSELQSVVKERWGFVPGAEDTLELDAGHAVMGDTTYNHVYGSSTTTGDISNALKAGQQVVPPPGHTGVLALPAVNRRLTASLASLPQHNPRVSLAAAIPLPASPTPAAPPAVVPDSPPPSAIRPASAIQHRLPASAAALSPARYRGGGLSRFGAAALAVQAAASTPTAGPATEMTMRLLQDDDATGHWRQPLFAAHAQTTAAAPQVQQQPASQQPYAARGSATAVAPAQATTTGMYASLEAVAAVVADSGGPTEVTFGGGANYTAQLLADNTTAQFMRRGRCVGGGGGLMGGSDVTCASSSGVGLFGGRQGVTGGFGAQLSPRAASQPEPLHSPQQFVQLPRLTSSQPTQPSYAAPAPNQQPPPAASAATGAGRAAGGSGDDSGWLMDTRDLTLDDFALPPEPALDGAGGALQGPAAAAPVHQAPIDELDRGCGRQDRPGSSALAAVAVMGGVAASADLSALAAGHVAAAAAPAAGAAPLAPAACSAPSEFERPVSAITCTDFLHIVELRFLDDMRRKSVLHPPFLDMRGGGSQGLGGGSQGGGAGGTAAAAAAPALGIAECYERVHVDGVKLPLLEGMASNVASWLEDVEARIGVNEVALARQNPPLFRAVQVADGDALDALQFQMKMLKKVCRNRTARVWKQLRTEYEQALAHALHDSMAALQADAGVLQGCVEQFAGLESQVAQLRSDVVQQASADQAEQQAAARRQERQAAQRQRLVEVESSNQQREQRLEQASERRTRLQRDYEDVLQRKAELQRRLQVLRTEAVVVETPSKEAAEVRRQRALEEELDVVLGLQGMKLDASNMATHRKLSCTICGQFCVWLEWPQTEETAEPPCDASSSAPCYVSTELLLDGFPHSSAAALQPLLAATAAAAQQIVPATHVRTELGRLLTKLWRCSRLVEEIGAAWQAWPQLSSVSVSSEAVECAATGAAATAVVLTFVHGRLHVKASVALPWECLLGGGTQRLVDTGLGRIVVRVHLPLRVVSSALQAEVLRRLSAVEFGGGAGMLHTLCHFMSDEGMALITAAHQCSRSAADLQDARSGTKLPALVVAPAVLYDNPLYTAAS